MILKGKRTLKKPIEMQAFFHFYNWATYSGINYNMQINRSPVTSLYNLEREWKHGYTHTALPETGRSLVIEADGKPIGQINYQEINRVCNAACINVLIAEDVQHGKVTEPVTIKTLVSYLFEHMDIEKCEIEVPVICKETIDAYYMIGFNTIQSYIKNGTEWQKMELHKNQFNKHNPAMLQAAL